VRISWCARLVCSCSMQFSPVCAAYWLPPAMCRQPLPAIVVPEHRSRTAALLVSLISTVRFLLLLQAGLLPSSPVAASCAMIPDDDEAGSPLQQIEADMELMLQVGGGRGLAQQQQQQLSMVCSACWAQQRRRRCSSSAVDHSARCSCVCFHHS
jgi:hypothetical protein